MNKKLKTLALTLVFLLMLTNINVYATTTEKGTVDSTEIKITSSKNEIITKTGKTISGEDYILIIEPVFKKALVSDYMASSVSRSSLRSWKVSFFSGIVNAKFYMDVDDNKVVVAYNETCSGLIYGSELVQYITNATYKLDYGLSIGGGIGLNFHGWLKGTCTGSDNDINVTFNFPAI